jgi:hypothetical protein
LNCKNIKNRIGYQQNYRQCILEEAHQVFYLFNNSKIYLRL